MATGVSKKRVVGSHRTGGAEEEDSFSSLPDEILHQILCFLPTKLAVRFSVLSKRWKSLWCDTPCVSFSNSALLTSSRDNTQNRYTAQKMMSLHLCTRDILNVNNIDTWIELAMIRRVENLSLELNFMDYFHYNYTLPGSVFTQSSLKELSVAFGFKPLTVPEGSVSWTSLKKLSLRDCKLSDESLVTIQSGCPVLESLTLCFCGGLTVVDLSNSPSVRALELLSSGCIKLLPTLVDVSSLAEAKLNMLSGPYNTDNKNFKGTVRMMLESLQSVEKLSFGFQFLQVLSRPKLLDGPFPMLKVKDLTLDTTLHTNVIPPGIQRLLRNSPDLKKLRVNTRTRYTKPRFRGSNSRRDAESKHVASLLKKMVVRVKDFYLEARGFIKTVQTVSHNKYNNKVSIVVSDIS